MSKAFTSEETPELEPVVRPPPRVAPGEVRYVTPEGREALRAELGRLAAQRVAAARLPDAERAARIADVDRRVAVAEATLAALTVLGPDAATEGRVSFATWVTVEDAEGRRTTWRIVGPDESAPRRGLLGVDSPVARALLGREVGDEVEVERPGGTLALTVVDVARSPR
jgi:transcription elongation factor GreB